ncbi:MAG: PAS domain S-box protein [Chloroflexi bacterium]|nr:PAS domain S-box protein [Chloroflexota bacterium]
MKLRHKIPIIGTFLVLFGVMSTAYSAIYLGNLSQKASIEAYLLGVSQLKTNRLNAYFEERVSDINNLASFAKQMQLLPSSETSTPIQPILSESLNSQRQLEYLLNIFPKISAIQLIDTKGEIYLSSIPGNEGMLLSNTASFIEGQKGLHNNIYYNIQENKQKITISRPILDEEGVLLAVIEIVVDHTSVVDMMQENNGLGSTGETYLVNDNNSSLTALSNSSSSYFIRTEGVINCIENKDNRASRPSLYPNYSGELVLGTCTHLSQYKIVLVAEVSQEEAFAFDRRFTYLTVGIALLITVLSVALAYRFMSLVLEPINEFANGVKIISDGNLKHRIRINSKDQIEILASGFNQMAKKLSNSFSALEDQVRKLDALVEISKKISVLSEADELFPYIVRYLEKMFIGTSATIIMICDENFKEIEPKSYDSMKKHAKKHYSVLPGEPSIIQEVQKTKQPVLVSDVLKSPHIISPRIAKQFPHKSILGLPIIIDEKVIGLTILSKDTRHLHDFSEHEIRLALSAVQQLTSAILNANLFKKVSDSEFRYRSIFNSMQDLFFTTDNNDIVTDASPSIENYTDFSRKEFIGKSVQQFFVSHQNFLDLNQELKKTGVVKDYEIMIFGKDQKKYICSTNIHLTFDKNGKPTGTSGILRDISARKKAETELYASEERLKLAVEGGGVGLWDWQIQTDEAIFNEKWAQIIGYKLEELEPTSIATWIDFCHPDDLKKSNRLLEQHISGESEIYECEARMKHKKGHWVWVLDRGKVVQWGEDGKPLRMTGTHLNITDRVKARQSLEERERHYRDLFNSVPDAILVIEIEKEKPIIKAANPAFANLMKQPAETFLEQNAEMFHFCGGQEFKNRISTVHKKLQKKERWQKVVEIETKSGEKIDAAFVFTATCSGNNHPTGFILSIRDITESNALERMKSNFVSNISHELRTPLSIISLYCENLIEFYSRMNDKQRKETLLEISTEALVLQELIEDVLLLSKLDSRSTLNVSEIALGDFLRDIVKKETLLNKRRKINIKLQSPEKEVYLLADKDKLRQAFRNLIGNATKFSLAEDDVLVKFSENDNTYFITIQDHGIGIPEDELPHIMERFSRGNYALKKEISGTGLGLSITNEIIKKHGGKLEFKSELGKGTTAKVMLPK